MAIKWQIPFASLRTGTIYTVNVYDASYSGSPIVLKGGAAPFTTQEDSDDDPFSPIRIQTGTLCIIDDGYAADGVTAFNWKDFVPSVASSRPVTLTHTVNKTIIVDWQGFIQSQDFSGTLYGNPQERQFPIHCALEVMKSQQPSTSDIQKHNFAWLIDYAATTAETLSGNAIGFDNFYVQGNADAQLWLLKQFELMNFMNENDDDAESEVEPKYNIYEILEDTFKFWGWTARTQGRNFYLTCFDDLTEPKWVKMTRAQLQTMAGGTVAGTNDQTFIATTLSGDIFASTDNDDFKRRGPSKATVQADCNEQDTLFEFAPASVEKIMDQSGYVWVAGEDASTGYFTTTPIRSFDSKLMAGSSNSYGGFCRRQIFSDAEADKATKEDMFVFKNGYTFGQSVVQIQTKKAMNYAGGSLKISGDVFDGVNVWNDTDRVWSIVVKIGIGLTRETAKWYYIGGTQSTRTIVHRWQSDPAVLYCPVQDKFKTVGGLLLEEGWLPYLVYFESVPCDDYGLYGYIFVDFLGMNHDSRPFEVGNFKITYSRDEIFIPTSIDQPKPRVMSEDRVSSFDYSATNSNGTGEDWNADCIYASDNNMKYGYGLIINPDSTFMETAPYGSNNEYPEQHLANRVAAYWAQSKRQITTELRTDAIAAITPRHRLTLDGTVFNPTAISRNWRDDVTILTLLESRTS
jgi:hypothetical protein